MTDESRNRRADDSPPIETTEHLASGGGIPLDWRMRFSTTLAADVPAAFPGGPSHRAGAPVILVTVGPGTRGKSIAFATPSSPALFLSAAMRAANLADGFRASVRFEDHLSPGGPAQGVSDDSTESLYDFFEQAVATVVFSYQAVEAFANEEVQRLVTTPMTLDLRGRLEQCDAEAIERRASTEQKLVDVLPSAMQVRPAKKSTWWSSFKALARIRNDIVHLKAARAYPRSASGVAAQSIFHELLFTNSLLSFPKTSIAALEHFQQGDPPGWLVAAKEKALGK
jgi:hypothetical protein